MIDFLKKDTFLSGALFSLLLNLLAALLLCAGLRLCNADILLNLKIFIFSPIPSVFLLRYHISKQSFRAMRGCVLVLVVCLFGLIVSFLSMNIFDQPFNNKIRL